MYLPSDGSGQLYLTARNWLSFTAVIKQTTFLSATRDSEYLLFVVGDWVGFQEHGTRTSLIRNLAKLIIISPINKLLRRIRLEATIQIQKALN